ncbi:MAG: pantoate--beta-alanine ligase [Pseudohongiellaceae bacterium]
MNTVETNEELRTVVAAIGNKTRIGFVPTMGNLHAGHIKLIHAARANCDKVICSIFVNPTQFGPDEDLANYPRTLTADKLKLEAAGCDIVFTPSVEELYGQENSPKTSIHVPGVSENFCGGSRPGHFDGVATVVCKLLCLVQPTHAYFGLKDYQQFLVIKKLVADLHLPVTVTGIETEREVSGLAMSSRNGYLDDSQLEIAAKLYETLQQAAKELAHVEDNFHSLTAKSIARLEDCGLKVDYFAVCNADDLTAAQLGDRNLAILAAVYLANTRLIDNIRVQL